jgi:predicted transglutaminase-like cysteine proteinase
MASFARIVWVFLLVVEIYSDSAGAEGLASSTAMTETILTGAEMSQGSSPAHQRRTNDIAMSAIALPTAPGRHRGQDHSTASQEPFGGSLMNPAPTEIRAKWTEFKVRLASELDMLRRCQSADAYCSPAARRLLHIIELGRQRDGRARIGEINRAVNLSIRPTTDSVRHGVDDFWSTPLATLGARAGDCEDYAIVKYVALHYSGMIPEDDIRIVIVGDRKHNTAHAVVTVRYGDRWLILDNRTLVLVDSAYARHYNPLFVLDHRGVRAFGTLAFQR